jgi:hypothetical protein
MIFTWAAIAFSVRNFLDSPCPRQRNNTSISVSQLTGKNQVSFTQQVLVHLVHWLAGIAAAMDKGNNGTRMVDQ